MSTQPATVPKFHKRYPHMTAHDVDVLDWLRATRGAAAALDFQRVIQTQHRRDTRYRALETVETDLGVDIDLVIGERDADFGYGAGGGTRRRIPDGDD